MNNFIDLYIDGAGEHQTFSKAIINKDSISRLLIDYDRDEVKIIFKDGGYIYSSYNIYTTLKKLNLEN